MRPGVILTLAIFLLGITCGIGLGNAAALRAQENGPNELAAAQVAMGSAFTYQGHLEHNGAPANGHFQMRFTLFDVPTGGQQVGRSLTINSVAVSNGLFAVQLNFDADAFRGEARFLSVEVRPQGSSGSYTTLIPRQEITPTPYALFSAGAPWSGLTGIPANINSLSALNCSPDQVALYDGNSWVCSDQVKNLTAEVEELKSLLAHFTRSGNDITISGANLHIVNGTGATDSPSNGLGNLIIGYNEERNDMDAQNIRTGSHMLVVGKGHNYTGFGGIVVGQHHTVSGDFASISGGRSNVAEGNWSAVSGGNFNVAAGLYASVSGGADNHANGGASSISGGESNNAEGDLSSISGGLGNTASNLRASVLGGQTNHASGEHATVSGGRNNTASGEHASVSGGLGRVADGPLDWRAGGAFQTD